jgi:signal transduction histidine kinase
MSSILLHPGAARLREVEERRLARLALDLHDGALQDVASLLADVRFFRSRLESYVSSGSCPERLLGCVDDLEGRVVSIDSRLRDLIADRDRDRFVDAELASALRREARAFAGRTGISVRFTQEGCHDDVDPAHSAELARVLREALLNVERHSGAASVVVALSREESVVVVDVIDDGSGFDVEEAVLVAARRGRLGLAGMEERVRQLGGSLWIESEPAGPTSVSIRVPVAPVTEPVGRSPQRTSASAERHRERPCAASPRSNEVA